MKLNIPRFRYIAMNRLGFTDAEACYLSFGEFADLYREYQKLFDIENILYAAKRTYESVWKEEAERERPIAF